MSCAICLRWKSNLVFCVENGWNWCRRIESERVTSLSSMVSSHPVGSIKRYQPIPVLIYGLVNQLREEALTFSLEFSASDWNGRHSNDSGLNTNRISHQMRHFFSMRMKISKWNLCCRREGNNKPSRRSKQQLTSPNVEPRSRRDRYGWTRLALLLI